MSREKTILTFSSLSRFLSCPEAYRLRYECELTAAEKTDALNYGTVWHDAMEVMSIAAHLPDVTPTQAVQAAAKFLRDSQLEPELKLKSLAALRAYTARWVLVTKGQLTADTGIRDCDFDEVHREVPFAVPLINPETGRRSRTFELRGKIDCVPRIGGALFVMEHKTTSDLTGQYVDRLWSDFQVRLYSDVVRQVFGEAPSGVIYDVTARPKLSMKEEKRESQGDWLARIEGYKTEKTKQKHREAGPKFTPAETPLEFLDRLHAWFDDPKHEGTFRTFLPFTDREIEQVRHTAWNTAEMIRQCRKTGRWPQNWNSCFAYRRPCTYTTICKHGGEFRDELALDHFAIEEPHQETVGEDFAARVAKVRELLLRVERGEGQGIPMPNADPEAVAAAAEKARQPLPW